MKYKIKNNEKRNSGIEKIEENIAQAPFKTNFSYRATVSVVEIVLTYIHTAYKCVIKIYQT